MMGHSWLFNRTRHGSEGRLMQHKLHPLAGLVTYLLVCDVPLDPREIPPFLRSHQIPDGIQIAEGAGGKVVDTRHQPSSRRVFQFLFQFVVSAHVFSKMWKPSMLGQFVLRWPRISTIPML